MSTETVNPLICFFSGISGGTKSVITQALADAVLVELRKPNLDTLTGVEKMILAEHTEPIQKDATKGHSIISEIKVHSRKPMNWTPKTGEEMRTLFKNRDQDKDICIDLCPANNPGVWMRLKMRQEFKNFELENFNNKTSAKDSCSAEAACVR
jgi:hypothetical protein